MGPSFKKKVVAAMLFVACVLSGWLLLIAPAPAPSHRLQNVGQVDSLLQHTFTQFDIPQARVSTYLTKVDSDLKRKTLVVEVSPSFPQTQFHAALKHQLGPYRISLPARVIFPEKNMHIYLSYRQTIIRTVVFKIRNQDEKDKKLRARLELSQPPSLKTLGAALKSAIILRSTRHVRLL